MKSKNLFIVAILLCLSIGLKAQDKYEQAVVSQLGNNELEVSTEGQEFKTEKIKAKTVLDLSPLLKELAIMRNDGWEVWNSTSTATGVTTYFLRRKIK
jgi:hypothetical protein